MWKAGRRLKPLGIRGAPPTATSGLITLRQRELRRGKIVSTRQPGLGFLDPEFAEITLGTERPEVSDMRGQ
jgi:hypothetical protein